MKKFKQLFIPLLFSTLFLISIITDFSSNSFVSPTISTISSPRVSGIESEINENFGVEPVEKNAEQLNGLGIIAIDYFDVAEELDSAYFNDSNDPNIEYNHRDAIFIQTTQPASTEEAVGGNSGRNCNISIKLTEKVLWTYTSEAEHYVVGFSPYVQPAYLEKMFFNGTELTEENYSIVIDSESGIRWFNFNFTSIFKEYSEGEFELQYYYIVDVPVSNWKVGTVYSMPEEGWDSETPSPYQYIDGLESTFTLPYEYNVTFGKNEWNYNVSARFNVTLPDPDFVFDVQVDLLNGLPLQTASYQNNNNQITILKDINLNDRDDLDLRFKANFTVKLLESIDNVSSWCEDRLIRGTNIRQRDYKLTVTQGPESLALAYFGLNDTSIYFDDVNDIDPDDRIVSALGRYTPIDDMNMSTGDPSGTVVDGNRTLEYIDGITMLIRERDHLFPYILFKDEIDIITVTYEAMRDLQFIITDSVHSPLKGIYCNIYFAGEAFGSQMSHFINLPYPTKLSDRNGQVTLYDVPIGDYTIEILDSNGIALQNLTASSLKTAKENTLITQISHFPLTILVFSGVSVISIIYGLLIYRKNAN